MITHINYNIDFRSSVLHVGDTQENGTVGNIVLQRESLLGIKVETNAYSSLNKYRLYNNMFNDILYIYIYMYTIYRKGVFYLTFF